MQLLNVWTHFELRKLFMTGIVILCFLKSRTYWYLRCSNVDNWIGFVTIVRILIVCPSYYSSTGWWNSDMKTFRLPFSLLDQFQSQRFYWKTHEKWFDCYKICTNTQFNKQAIRCRKVCLKSSTMVIKFLDFSLFLKFNWFHINFFRKVRTFTNIRFI